MASFLLATEFSAIGKFIPRIRLRNPEAADRLPDNLENDPRRLYFWNFSENRENPETRPRQRVFCLLVTEFPAATTFIPSSIRQAAVPPTRRQKNGRPRIAKITKLELSGYPKYLETRPRERALLFLATEFRYAVASVWGKPAPVSLATL